MNLTFKTWETLRSEGFKSDYPRCYKGEKRLAEAKFPDHWRHSLLGKKAKVLSVDFEYGQINVEVGSHIIRNAPVWIFVEEPNLLAVKGSAKKRFTFSSNPVVHTPGVGFKFPCDMDSLTEEQAVKVAKWILSRVK